GRGDSAAAHVEAFAERRKRRRRSFHQPRNQRGAIGKKLQRLVVQSGKGVADERGRSIGKNRRDQILASNGLVKHLTPHGGRQRDGNLVPQLADVGRREERRDAPAHRLVAVRT